MKIHDTEGLQDTQTDEGQNQKAVQTGKPIRQGADKIWSKVWVIKVQEPHRSVRSAEYEPSDNTKSVKEQRKKTGAMRCRTELSGRINRTTGEKKHVATSVLQSFPHSTLQLGSLRPDQSYALLINMWPN